MRKILVTGSNGQLGNELRLLLQKQNHFFTDKTMLDIADKERVEEFCKKHAITHIVNCAAYTAVDTAEQEQEQADAVNHRAVRNLAEIAKKYAISLVHISTDYVFDGKNYAPYKETDTTNPQGVYGATKLAGEAAMVRVAPKNSIIIRTSWVYSGFGHNFVKTMLRLGKERDALGVVFDQIGTPTYARDLARAILQILPQLDNDSVAIYHYSDEGVCSWFDFAVEIMRTAKLDCRIDPIETKAYPTPAKRPHYSVLNKTKIKDTYDLDIPYWKDSLESCLQILGEIK